MAIEMRIGEVARRAGVATSALRYYEAAGLLGPARRTEAGYRLYGADAMGRIEFVRRAKALGIKLSEIKRLVDGPRLDAEQSRGQLRHLLAHKLGETQERIAQLQILEQELRSLYVRLVRSPGPDCGHVGDCGCWLPTEEEVRMMAGEIQAANGGTCCLCDDPDCDNPCDCSGR